MNSKTIIILVVVLGVILALALVLNREGEEPGLKQEAGFVDLTPEGFLISKVTRIELYAGAKPDEKVVMENRGDAWLVASRFDAPADEEKITEFLEKVKKLTGEFRSDKASELGRYELNDEDALHIVLTLGEGEAPVHLLAGKTIDWKESFVRKEGDDNVYVVDVALRSEVGMYGSDADQTPEATRWLDTQILDIEKDDIRKVAIQWPDKQVGFEKLPKPEGEDPEDEPAEEPEGEDAEPKGPELVWTLASGGPGGEFEEDALDKILGELESFSGDDVVDPARLADWGLETLAWKIDIEMADGKTYALVAGRPNLDKEGYVMLEGGGSVYKISKRELEKVFVKGSDLFELKGFDIEKDGIAEISLVIPDLTVEADRSFVRFTRADDQWVLATPKDAFEVEQDAVDDLVEAIADWTPDDYADAPAFTGHGLKPAAEIGDQPLVFKTEDGKTHAIEFGAMSKCLDGRYVLIDGTKLGAVAGRTTLDDLQPPLGDLIDLALTDLEADKIKSITVEGEGGLRMLTRTDGGWGVSSYADVHEADDARVDDLLDALISLKAVGVFAEATEMKAWEARVTATPKEGDPVVVTIAADRRTRVSGTPVDVRLSGETVKALTPAVDDLKKAPPAEPDPEEEDADEEPAEDEAAE